MIDSKLSARLVIVKGGGDLASGVIYRLKRAGFPVIVTELPIPLLVRRTVSFGEAIFAGQVEIEGMIGRRAESAADAVELAGSSVVPVLVDPAAEAVRTLRPAVVIDAIMAKRNTSTRRSDASLVVALGPGFTAGVDCHVAVETLRGHRLGRLIYDGGAAPDTGTPGVVRGHAADRVLRAPADGHVDAAVAIGERVAAGEVIATVAGIAVRAPFAGMLRGIVHPSVHVTPGMKIGDLDPRGVVAHCFTISDKALAMGGAVLEAVLAHQHQSFPHSISD